MGTTVAPQASSIAGSITSYGRSGLGNLGGMLVDLGSVYNSVGDSGGVMAAASDKANEQTDYTSPNQAPKADLSQEEADKLLSDVGDIQRSDLTEGDKKAKLSELLSKAKIPHDPASLSTFGLSDDFGLLSKRVNIAAPQVAAKPSGGGSQATGTLGGGADSAIMDAAAADASATYEDLNASTVGNDILMMGVGADQGLATDSSTTIQADFEHPWQYDGNGQFTNIFTNEVITNQAGTENLVVGQTYSDGTPSEATLNTGEATNSQVTATGDANTEDFLDSVITSLILGASQGNVVSRDSANSVDPSATNVPQAADTTNVADTTNTTDTTNTNTTAGVADTTVIKGGSTNNVLDTTATGATVTINDAVSPIAKANDGEDGVDGKDGLNGLNGQNGQNGKDGKDGKDGAVGLFSQIIGSAPITESLIFETNMRKLDNIKQGMFEEFLRAAGGR